MAGVPIPLKFTQAVAKPGFKAASSASAALTVVALRLPAQSRMPTIEAPFPEAVFTFAD
jgi:hypothetical protein